MNKVKYLVYRYRYQLLLIFLPFLVFWRNLLPIPGRVFFGNDAILSFYTLASITHQIRDGILPLWDPHTFFGVPLLTRPDSLVFYPPFGLLVLISAALRLSDRALYTLMEYVTVAHVSLAGLLTYYFLKKSGISNFSSFIGGLIYMLGGSLIAFVNTTGLLISMSYFPLILVLFDRLVKDPRLKHLFYFSLVFSLPILTFAWTSAIVYHCIFLFLYFWYLFFTKELPGFLKPAIYAGIGLVLSALLSAVVVLPGLEVPLVSNRANIDYSRSAYGGNLRPRQLFDFIIPYLSAKNYGERDVINLYFETLPYTYVGILSLLLIIPAFFTKRRYTIFYFVSALVIILFALGGETPVFGIIYLMFFPIMKPFSEPRLSLYMAQFFLAVVAAFGLENLYLKYDELKHLFIQYRPALIGLFKIILFVSLLVVIRVDQILWAFVPSELTSVPLFSQLNVLAVFIFIFSASLVCFQIQGGEKKSYFTLLIFFTVFLDLFLFAEKYPINNIGIDPSRLLSNNGIVKFITKENGNTFYRSDVRELPVNYASALYKINHIDGYLVYLPKIPYMFYELLSRNPRNNVADNIAGVRYVVTEGLISQENYKLAFEETINSQNQPYFYHLGGGPPTGWVPVPLDTKIRVYENTNYSSRARLVTRVTTISDDADAAKTIAIGSFDPNIEAIIDDTTLSDNNIKLVLNSEKIGSVLPLPSNNYDQKFVAEGANNSLFVTNLPFNNDWRVQVDGHIKPVVRTNLSFMGVFLEAGKRVVRFYYFPRAFIWGVAVSSVTLIFVLLSLIFIYLRKVIKFGK